ncbi:MAG: hypothetical protein M1478_06820 [Deltaproteobacteria bacterium]|jgi:hypothetical protein|nr:hypothetical protein [Deltaproteobacteria bacterium]MCL5880520.1 hypothetical protein [Deltaproteobacteria bacterium]
MRNAEFETEIKNGVINLLKEYLNAKKAKVIILDNDSKSDKDFIFRTVNNPVHLDSSTSFLSREEANER